MIRSAVRTIPVLILVLIALLMLSGCSSERSTVLQPQTQASPNEDLKPTPYPTWTEQDLATLIPGVRILATNERASTLDDQGSARIRRTVGGSVNWRNNGVAIGPWQLWEDQTVTVSTPNPGHAVVDFYPHPYHFNGCIRMWLDLSVIELPAGRRWDEVQFYYVDEAGNCTRYWGQIDLVAHRYYAWPDHFSRYIIGMPEQ